MVVKKLFALASVTALAGLVSAVGAAGCSETVEPDSTPADAGSDAKTTKDATPPTDDDDDDNDPGCMVQDPIDATKFAYNKARRSPGACTEAEAKRLFSNYEKAGNNVTQTKLAEGLSADCSTCAFSAPDADPWGAFHMNAKGELAGFNLGSCMEIVSGNEACGRSYQQFMDCRFEACLTDCQTNEEVSACLQNSQAIFQGPCKTAVQAVLTECGDSVDAYQQTCQGEKYIFEGPLRAQCVGGFGDDPDAGDGGN